VYDSAWSRDDAQAALAARVLERDAPKPEARPVALGELRDRYLAYKRAEGKRSVGGDESNLARLVAWLGAETAVAAVTAEKVADYSRDRAGQTSRLGRTVSPATRNRELATLRHALRLACEWGYVEKVPRIRMAREPEGRLRFLSEDEAARLLDACRRSLSRHLAAVVTVALYTGMRRGEVLGLEWERVDFSRGVLLVEATKTGRQREVPMGRPVYDALSALPGPRDEGPVFRKASGAAWGSIRTGFERACREARLGDFRFHDLRHTCASWLVMAGRSLKEVQELLGHRTFAMTLRYAHLSPDRLRDAVNALPVIGAVSSLAVQPERESLASR
jgi:integrase